MRFLIKFSGYRSIKICCSPGDFVVWDSRVVHCGSASSKPRPLPEDGSSLPLRRIVAYVCMTPASRYELLLKNDINPKNRLTPEILAKRQDAYYQGHTTSHWPEECLSGLRKNTNDNYKPPVLTEAQQKLIPLTAPSSCYFF